MPVVTKRFQVAAQSYFNRAVAIAKLLELIDDEKANKLLIENLTFQLRARAQNSAALRLRAFVTWIIYINNVAVYFGLKTQQLQAAHANDLRVARHCRALIRNLRLHLKNIAYEALRRKVFELSLVYFVLDFLLRAGSEEDFDRYLSYILVRFPNTAALWDLAVTRKLELGALDEALSLCLKSRIYQRDKGAANDKINRIALALCISKKMAGLGPATATAS